MNSLHQPLRSSERQIRLLRILPHSGETICCELVAINLDSPPDFTALSYCWTQHPPSHGITVNGVDFFVRPNLYNFLCSRLEENAVGWLFIDAICINQEDTAEKSRQVALMGDVYRAAQDVVAWLDDEKTGTSEYDQFASLLQDLCDRGHELLHSPRADFSALVESEWDIVPLIAMSFCNSTYWTRVWIVQELTLGRVVTLRTKRLKIDWAVLLLFLNCRFKLLREEVPLPELDNGHDPVDNVDDGVNLTTLGMTLRSIEQMNSVELEYYRALRTLLLLNQKRKFEIHAGDDGVELRAVISVYASQQCYDVHDKVYGVMGMTRSKIPVDYASSIPELYVETLIDLLMDDVCEAALSGRLGLEQPIRNTISLIISLRDGLGFWEVVLRTVEVLQAFDLPIKEEVVDYLVGEYTPLARLENIAPYAVKQLKGIRKRLASVPLTCLPFIKAVESWVTKPTRGKDDGKPSSSWSERIQQLYEEASERKFAAQTEMRLISDQLRQIGDMPLNEARKLIQRIGRFPTYVEVVDLFVQAFEQLLAHFIGLKDSQEPEDLDNDVFCACKLFYLRNELLRAIRLRRNWGFNNEVSNLESEKGNKAAFDSAIDAFICAGYLRLATIKELSIAQYETWVSGLFYRHHYAIAARKGLELSNRHSPMELLRCSLSRS